MTTNERKKLYTVISRLQERIDHLERQRFKIAAALPHIDDDLTNTAAKNWLGEAAAELEPVKMEDLNALCRE